MSSDLIEPGTPETEDADVQEDAAEASEESSND